MFVRRLYYDTTGAMLHSYMMAGSITVLPADEVAAGLGLDQLRLHGVVGARSSD